MMEAIERVCAEEVTGERRRGSFVELAAGDDRAIDPSRFQLPDDTAYDPRREYDWVPGWDLMEGGRVWAPEDLVRTPPQAGILHDVDTNGVASGNCLVEAVVHALCEVIERDALSQRHFLQLFGEVTRTAAPRRLDLLTLPASLLRWVERIEQEGMLLDVLDITSDVGVPTFHALLTAPLGLADMGRGQATTFFGLGTHPTASVALSRAVTEVIQARLGVIQGARDSYNRMSGRQRASARRRMLTRLESGESVDFRTFDEVRNEDLLDDLAFIVAALRRAGIDHAYAFDLSRPGLGVAVVRVRVPGLSQFCLNMRRVGPRCLRHLV
jgi:ribosomal protein S12 methylthiotransferase accessory factor